MIDPVAVQSATKPLRALPTWELGMASPVWMSLAGIRPDPRTLARPYDVTSHLTMREPVSFLQVHPNVIVTGDYHGKAHLSAAWFLWREESKTTGLQEPYRASRSNLRALGGGGPRGEGVREKETAQERKSAQEKPVRGVKGRADRPGRRAHLESSVILIT